MHKCEYCNSQIKPCVRPCLEAKQDKSHVCCTCDKDEKSCELPERIVCSDSLCNLKYSVEYYKLRLEELKSETTQYEAKIKDLKELSNEWRLVNLDRSNIVELVNRGAVGLGNIKLFVTQRKLTWDRFPVDIGYTIMCLHEEFSKQWANWLNEKAVKITIKKDIVEASEKKLKTAQATRDGLLNANGEVKKVKVTLNDKEKVVLHYMKKLGLSQVNAVASADAMGMTGEVRDLKSLGVI